MEDDKAPLDDLAVVAAGVREVINDTRGLFDAVVAQEERAASLREAHEGLNRARDDALKARLDLLENVAEIVRMLRQRLDRLAGRRV